MHYPAPYEEWSRRAAARLESIRAAVVEEVGYDAPQVIDVIISNPVAAPNGVAWPFLDTPRILLYTEPPGPDEQIGSYTRWVDLLAVHELTHIVQMLRPSRNPIQRLAERSILPLNPITLTAPRWVLEGYATVIEGRLTGAGRPSSTMRALILRKWAASGRLPTYAQLNSDSRFLGMSMAYLAGSAFLEWLEQRAEPGSLQRLWLRMTARGRRSFQEAFAGVYGESPDRLYGRFTAELTASAMTIERAGGWREGELWQETTRASGDPVVSPDGSRLAMVLRSKNLPPRIVVYSTAPAEEEERRYAQRTERLARQDPLDVPAVRLKPLARKPLFTFVSPDGGDLSAPRWMPDGESILYTHRTRDPEGFLHHDLYIWTPRRGGSRAVTHLQDVQEGDPLSASQAVAVRNRYGYSQLVTVDLADGSVRDLTLPSVEVIYAHPRVDPARRSIAYVINRGGLWELASRSMREGQERILSAPGNVASPAWSASGEEIYATVSNGGFAEIYRFASTAEPVTRSRGGAFQPAPAPDGRIYFMSLQPDGFVVRLLAPPTVSVPQESSFDQSLVPALPPAAGTPVTFGDADVPPSRPYGLGRQERSWLIGQNLASKQTATEIGLRFGDVIGRLDTIALLSLARDDGQRGAAVASAWRGWPQTTLSAHLFRTEDQTRQRNGIEVRGLWTHHWQRASIWLTGGALAAKPVDLSFAAATARLRHVTGPWRFQQTLRAAAERGKATHWRGISESTLVRGEWRLAASYQRDGITRSDAPFETIELGGLPSSVLPASAVAYRVHDPALPVRLLAGDTYEGWRLDAHTPLLPAALFWQQHRVSGREIALIGATYARSLEPMPLLKLPALDVTLGAARILHEPLKGRVRWWLGMRWRP